jgi:hypothetical protein
LSAAICAPLRFRYTQGHEEPMRGGESRFMLIPWAWRIGVRRFLGEWRGGMRGTAGFADIDQVGEGGGLPNSQKK